MSTPEPHPDESVWWSAAKPKTLRKLARDLPPLRMLYAPPWFVPSGQQHVFLAVEHKEVFFGGAAGPGKSTALLIAALQYVDVPGYAALILRKTLTDLQLPGALMEMAHQWLHDTDARWNGNTHTWSFPSGATLSFGHLRHELVKFRYQSAAFQFIGWDELTHFSETSYQYLFSRCRRPADIGQLNASPAGMTLADVPLRVRSASNPGGVGHDWVNRRLVNPATRRRRAVFIPALARSNPGLDVKAYNKMLAELPPVERRRLQYGDWTAREAGEVFDAAWFRLVERGTDDYPTSDALRTVRVWDLAATRPTPDNPDPDWVATLLVSRLRDGAFLVRHGARHRLSPKGVSDLLESTARRDGKGTHIWIEQEPGSSGKLYIDTLARTTLAGWPVKGQRSTGAKEVRAQAAATQAEASNVYVEAGPWVHAFLDEVDAFPHGSHDDFVDCLSLAVDKLTMGGPMRTSRPAARLPGHLVR